MSDIENLTFEKPKNLLDYYFVKIYKDNRFLGYVKSYRKHRNGRYRFERTNNLNNALKYISKLEGDRIELKLSKLKDKLRYNDSYSFANGKITEQEIRLSKLHTLKNIKMKTKILKTKI